MGRALVASLPTLCCCPRPQMTLREPRALPPEGSIARPDAPRTQLTDLSMRRAELREGRQQEKEDPGTLHRRMEELARAAAADGCWDKLDAFLHSLGTRFVQTEYKLRRIKRPQKEAMEHMVNGLLTHFKVRCCVEGAVGLGCCANAATITNPASRTPRRSTPARPCPKQRPSRWVAAI